jgi:uncharacterized protein YoxC
MIKEEKNIITIFASGVKNEIENIFSFVKSNIKGLINIGKQCYNTFIKPWAEPIINFAKNYMSVYSMCNNVRKMIRNGWGFLKNTFKTGRNYILNKPYEKYWNKVKTYGSKSVNQIKYIYQKASQYYDKGRNLYKDFKIKILNYKNPIENNISDIINSLNKSKEIKSEISDLKRKKSNEGLNEINEKKNIKDIESETKNKSEKMEELREDILTKVNSLKFYFGKFNNLSPKFYYKFQSDINNVEKLMNNSNEIEIEKIESIIFNTLKPGFTSLLNENNIKDFIMTL